MGGGGGVAAYHDDAVRVQRQDSLQSLRGTAAVSGRQVKSPVLKSAGLVVVRLSEFPIIIIHRCPDCIRQNRHDRCQKTENNSKHKRFLNDFSSCSGAYPL